MRYDFIIIGGGIAGLSAAAELSALGSVLVLEREKQLAYHASARSAALFAPRYGLAPVVALSLASDAAFRAMPGVLSERGMMTIGSADQKAEFARDRDAFRLDVISVAEAQARVPILNPETVAFAGVDGAAWDIDTDLLIQSHVKRLRANTGVVQTDAPVSAIRRHDGLWHVTAGREEHSGRVLINAAGAWADQIAGMAGARPVGLTPYRRSVARIPAPGGQGVSRWPILFGAGESWYAKPDAGALIVSPAEEHPMEPHDAWADDMVLAEGLARYEAMVTEPVTRVVANWAGLRTFAPDRVLVIGRDPAIPEFFWLAGQGGYGFQTSPAAARLAGDLLGERTTEFDVSLRTSLSPARFR